MRLRKPIFSNPHFHMLALIGLSAMLSACESKIHTRYSASIKTEVLDLVKLKEADTTGRLLYLNRYSILHDRKKRNWHHATLISSIAPGAQPTTPQQQISTSMEVTLHCENRKISVDLIRTHPEPLAQGLPTKTEAFSNGFVPLRDVTGPNQRLYKEVCR